MLQPEVYTVHMLDYMFLVEDEDIYRQTESSHHGPPQVPQSVWGEARRTKLCEICETTSLHMDPVIQYIPIPVENPCNKGPSLADKCHVGIVVAQDPVL